MSTEIPHPRYKHQELVQFAASLLVKCGLSSDRSQIIAHTLVEADLMGHVTHGLHLLPAYLDGVKSGGMNTSGHPHVVKDTGATIAWDGDYLSGPWLVHQAIDLALERIADHPVVAITISKSHHIGCLATYLERATDRGLMMILACSDPRNKSVVPFGGLDPVLSPNPLAAGIPTSGEPILFDISMSSIANGELFQQHKVGAKLDHPWLIDRDGQVTNDPEAFMKEPPASILPLGGIEIGYKGFALGLLVDLLTSGLGGFGRKKAPEKWGASVFLQMIDPEGFGGKDNFLKESAFLARTCMASTPVDKKNPVRLPGSRALKLKEIQKKEGLWLHPSIIPALVKMSEELGIPVPDSVS